MLRFPTRPPRHASLALALAIAVPAAARAQTPPAQSEADRRAYAEYMAGTEAFNDGRFEDAIRHFQLAFQLSNRPGLLHNIGSAYDRLHQWRDAHRAFSRYLELMPNAPNRAEVRARLRLIEAEIRREDELARAGRAMVVVQPTPPRVIVRHQVVVEQPRPWRAAALIGGGLAVISGGLVLTMGLLTNAYYDGLVEQCGREGRGCPEQVIQDITLRATLINAGLGATAVFAAGAATALVLDLARPREASAGSAGVRARLAPTFAAPGQGPTGGMLVLSGAL